VFAWGVQTNPPGPPAPSRPVAGHRHPGSPGGSQETAGALRGFAWSASFAVLGATPFPGSRRGRAKLAVLGATLFPGSRPGRAELRRAGRNSVSWLPRGPGGASPCWPQLCFLAPVRAGRSFAVLAAVSLSGLPRGPGGASPCWPQLPFLALAGAARSSPCWAQLRFLALARAARSSVAVAAVLLPKPPLDRWLNFAGSLEALPSRYSLKIAKTCRPAKTFTGDSPMPFSILVQFLPAACGATMAASCHAGYGRPGRPGGVTSASAGGYAAKGTVWK
jgi:hypothetical protein